MKAISIKQPWAWAIFHGKDIENRTWATRHRGPILIHAGKKIDQDGFDWLYDNQHLLDCPLPEYFDTGGIIGQVDIVDCVSASESPWFFGPKGFVLVNAKGLPHMAVKGMLGLFNVDYVAD